MQNEISTLIQMITAKVAGLVAQGMPEQAAFNAIMQRLETEHPTVFALLVQTQAA
jgi:hypothetical protein